MIRGCMFHGTVTDIRSNVVETIHFTQPWYEEDIPFNPWDLRTMIAQLELRLSASGADLSKRQLFVRCSEMGTRSILFRMEAPPLKERQADGR